VHSHPSPYPVPSGADLGLFGRFGRVHLIVASPYDERSWRAYDHRGNEIHLEVVENKST
jgi:proteasome lid subunit RPN8/RPN11